MTLFAFNTHTLLSSFLVVSSDARAFTSFINPPPSSPYYSWRRFEEAPCAGEWDRHGHRRDRCPFLAK